VTRAQPLKVASILRLLVNATTYRACYFESRPLLLDRSFSSTEHSYTAEVLFAARDVTFAPVPTHEYAAMDLFRGAVEHGDLVYAFGGWGGRLGRCAPFNESGYGFV
jgi:hypothetical protein